MATEPGHADPMRRSIDRAAHPKPGHPIVQSGSVSPRSLLQRKAGCACGGGCPRCQAAAAAPSRYTVNAPGDRYEQEADRVAEQVMRMPDPEAASDHGSPASPRQADPPSIQRACASCGSSSADEKRVEIQAKEEGGETPRVSAETGSRIAALRGGGEPLPSDVRSYFEPRFGHDFGKVRVHSGGTAAETARSVGAQAYTIGGDIVFGAGHYAPQSDTGRRLLAHELVHTIQQGASGPTASGGASHGRAGASGVHRAVKHGIQRAPERRIQRVTDASFESGSGLGPAITAGTMTTDPAIHGQTVTATNCFGRDGCNIRFRFAKAYRGDYNYAAAGGRAVRGVYIKLSVTYDAGACGPCNQVRLIQVVRSITQTGGNMVTADPQDATRQARSGWNDPNAASRGWRVDRLTSATVPYFTSGSSGQAGSATTPALLYDAPGDWATDTNKGLEFETCAICTPASGPSTSLACVRWGYYIDSSGTVSFRPAVPIAICGVTQHENDAVLRWGRIAGNTPANIDFRRQPPAP
jgi:hypothetical protein